MSDEVPELREGRVRSEPEEVAGDLARQAELEAEWAKRRAAESAELTANEAANYARHHATIERDENGNPIETEPKE